MLIHMIYVVKKIIKADFTVDMWPMQPELLWNARKQA